MNGISFVIIRFKDNYYEQLFENLHKTCNVPFEIIEINNKNSGFTSISTAYNSSFNLAKYEFICFLHEDVIFINDNWGKKIISTMTKHPNIGLLGLVGSKFKSYQTTSYTNKIENGKFIVGKLSGHKLSKDKDFEEVVCIDGVFLLTRKSIVKNMSAAFDEKIIKGFHGYDLDFSLQIKNLGFYVAVTDVISIKHFSEGKRDLIWYQTNQKISKKWKKNLPCASSDLNYTSFKLNILEIKTMVWLNNSNRIKLIIKFPILLLKFFLRNIIQ